jgi:hypothetical protein
MFVGQLLSSANMRIHKGNPFSSRVESRHYNGELPRAYGFSIGGGTSTFLAC